MWRTVFSPFDPTFLLPRLRPTGSQLLGTHLPQATVRRATLPGAENTGVRRTIPVVNASLAVTGEDGAFIMFTPGKT